MKHYQLNLYSGYQEPQLPGRDLWVKTLRGGEFNQGMEFLSSHGEYCCLGVLCVLQGRPQEAEPGFSCRIKFDFRANMLSRDNPLFYHLGENGLFPKGVSVDSWDDEDPADEARENNTCLSGCNDDGLTFLQIADIIEKVWENAPPCWEVK